MKVLKTQNLRPHHDGWMITTDRPAGIPNEHPAVSAVNKDADILLFTLWIDEDENSEDYGDVYFDEIDDVTFSDQHAAIKHLEDIESFSDGSFHLKKEGGEA